MHALKHISVPLLIIMSGFLCLEFSIPIALGEFFAGILGGMFLDLQNIPWLEVFSNLGVLSIMFLAGFEMDASVLKSHLRVNMLVGLFSFFTPFLAVLSLSLIAGIEMTQAIILGIALSTTSLAIIFSVLHDTVRINAGEKQILLGSAMVVDMLSVALFTVIFVTLSIEKLLYMGTLIVFIMIVKRVVVPIFKRYKGSRSEFELKFLLLVLICTGFIAELAGIHPAIIAFFMGVLLSGIAAEHEEINAKLSTIVFSLLAPIFFFYSGVLLQFSSFTRRGVILFFILAIAAFTGKYLGTYLGFRLFHGGNREMARYAGLIFNYRLSFGIVTAVAAYERGAIGAEVLNIALLGIACSAAITLVLEKRQQNQLKQQGVH